MTDCKPCITSVCPNILLSSHSGNLLHNATEYCQLVGSLQCFTFTRPDIANDVHHVAQFMSQPSSPHLAAKRILHYLNDTLTLVFTLRNLLVLWLYQLILILIELGVRILIGPLLVLSLLFIFGSKSSILN